jgi:iron complex outermembrane recepter protein
MLSLLLVARLAQDSPPPKTSDVITVTAARTPERLGDTPASVVVLSRQTIAATAAPTVDDVLRQVPGFTLFRRSGSGAANPTSQGASLRGLGGSGASRALVLDDGIPLNDPFGGWIYWGRVPRASLERIEVVRGGASDVYGSAAMGGVVQFIRRKDSIAVDASGGSQRTATASLFAPFSQSEWGASLAADFLTTAGYILVDPDQRGAIDRAASSRHHTIDLTLRRAGGFLRASHYGESRNNGTPLQVNDTAIRQVAAGYDSGSLIARADARKQDYHQLFSAIAVDRASERLTVDQRVPSRSAGASVQWTHRIARNQALIIGAEGRKVWGASEESQRVEGHQRLGAIYVEDVAQISSRVSATAAIRGDRWRNYDARRDGIALAERSDSSWSPRLSVLVRATDRLALTAAVYRAFRAPTLNELYRSFRVGNVTTLANESLGPERLSGFEVGARSGPLRVTLFSMTTSDTIANVTLSTTPTLITRQRLNFGSSRSRGAEIDYFRALANGWSLGSGYLFADATLSSGKRTPQVPRQQATLQLGYRALVGMQARWSTMQFDDDVNQFPLRGYFVVDLLAAHPLSSQLEATIAVENLFDRRVEAGATPVITRGQPRAIRAGVRYGFRR